MGVTELRMTESAVKELVESSLKKIPLPTINKMRKPCVDHTKDCVKALMVPLSVLHGRMLAETGAQRD